MIGWLSRLALTLGLFALVAFDGVALMTATVSASDQATTAASAAADSYRTAHDIQAAYDAAVAAVAGDGDTVETTSFHVGPDGHVSLRLRKTAATLWLQRVGPLEHYRHVSASGEGAPSS